MNQNVIKLDTVFTDYVEHVEVVETPSIRACDKAINTGEGGIVNNVTGFVILNNGYAFSFETKSPYFVYGYGIYNGTKEDTPSSSNFVEFVVLDGGSGGGTIAYDVTSLKIEANEGQFIVPLLVKNHLTTTTGDTIYDMIDM